MSASYILRLYWVAQLGLNVLAPNPGLEKKSSMSKSQRINYQPQVVDRGLPVFNAELTLRKTIIHRMWNVGHPPKVEPFHVVSSKHTDFGVEDVFPGPIYDPVMQKYVGTENLEDSLIELVSYEAVRMKNPGFIGFRILEKKYAEIGYFDDPRDNNMWLIECDLDAGEFIKIVDKVFSKPERWIPIKSTIGWCQMPYREVQLNLRKDKGMQLQCLDFEIGPGPEPDPRPGSDNFMIWVTGPGNRVTTVPFMQLNKLPIEESRLNGPGEPSKPHLWGKSLSRPVPSYDRPSLDPNRVRNPHVLTVTNQNTAQWRGTVKKAAMMQLCAQGNAMKDLIVHMSWNAITKLKKPKDD